MTLKAGLFAALGMLVIYAAAQLFRPAAEPVNGYLAIEYAYIGDKLVNILPIDARVSLADCKKALILAAQNAGPTPPGGVLVGACVRIPDSPAKAGAPVAAPVAPRVAPTPSDSTSV